MSEPGEAGNVESWLAREHHSCAHDRLLPWVEPRWLVAIDSTAVASMVAKSFGQTSRLNRRPSCRVDLGTGNARLECAQCGVLSSQHGPAVFPASILPISDCRPHLCRRPSWSYRASLVKKDLGSPSLRLSRQRSPSRSSILQIPFVSIH